MLSIELFVWLTLTPLPAPPPPQAAVRQIATTQKAVFILFAPRDAVSIIKGFLNEQVNLSMTSF
jgi:hypothetical protein